VIALARFPASVLLELLLTNVPTVEDEHPLEPSVPAVTEPHEKLLAVVPVVLRVTALPGARAVTTDPFGPAPLMPLPCIAVTPTAQLLIAEVRF
jgi:hypothetical protein